MLSNQLFNIRKAKLPLRRARRYSPSAGGGQGRGWDDYVYLQAGGDEVGNDRVSSPLKNSAIEMSDIQTLIPQHKSDLEPAIKAIEAGFPTVAPILPDLLEWLQDINWPVARILAPFLATIGIPLIPHIQEILKTDDEIWKYWIIVSIINNSPELAKAFRADLERLAKAPEENEAREELNLVAQEVLEKYDWNP
jgi:hypothetical protein